MERNNKKELQSRREFFKKAAKSVLPVVAAVALASAPTITDASETTPMGCSFSDCTMTCSGGCMGCTGGCTGSCKQSCSNNCFTACKGLGQNF